ncbi:hypothetical protein Ct61P_15077 [Colletotrichum tofieldiae]|nr:hypothetical protein Ct61P_15077 [Colletotrichum tofieldiae]
MKADSNIATEVTNAERRKASGITTFLPALRLNWKNCGFGSVNFTSHRASSNLVDDLDVRDFKEWKFGSRGATEEEPFDEAIVNYGQERRKRAVN